MRWHTRWRFDRQTRTWRRVFSYRNRVACLYVALNGERYAMRGGERVYP